MASRKNDKNVLPPKVRKRGKGYTYRYDIPIVLPSGKNSRKQKDTISYPTPEEAYDAGRKIEDKIKNGTYIDETNLLFTEWAKQAIELYAAEKKLKQRTVDGKLAHLKQAKIEFAGVRLKEITPLKVRQYFIALRDKYDLGQSAINGIYSTVCMIFRMAKSLKLIEDNPAIDAEKPVIKQTFEQLELQDENELPAYLEKEQVVSLLRTIKQQAKDATTPKEAFGLRQLYRIVYLLIYTGLRIGELCALEVSRADTIKKTIRVISTLYVGEGGIRNYILTTPKNDPSIRTVGFSEKVAAVIDAQILDAKAFRLLIGEKFYKEKSFVFISYRDYPGYPLHPATVEYTLNTSLIAAGLPTSITPHSLRHTYTSLSAEAGHDLIEIQKQLGHSKDEMTKRVYFHVTEAKRKANINKLDNLMHDLMSTLD